MYANPYNLRISQEIRAENAITVTPSDDEGNEKKGKNRSGFSFEGEKCVNNWLDSYTLPEIA